MAEELTIKFEDRKRLKIGLHDDGFDVYLFYVHVKDGYKLTWATNGDQRYPPNYGQTYVSLKEAFTRIAMIYPPYDKLLQKFDLRVDAKSKKKREEINAILQREYFAQEQVPRHEWRQLRTSQECNPKMSHEPKRKANEQLPQTESKKARVTDTREERARTIIKNWEAGLPDMNKIIKETEAAKIQHAYYVVYKKKPTLTLITKAAYDILGQRATRPILLPEWVEWKRELQIYTPDGVYAMGRDDKRLGDREGDKRPKFPPPRFLRPIDTYRSDGTIVKNFQDCPPFLTGTTKALFKYLADKDSTCW